MRRFRYVGPHDAVDLPGVGTVKRGQLVELEPELSRGLDGQATWEHVPDPDRSEVARRAAETRKAQAEDGPADDESTEG